MKTDNIEDIYELSPLQQGMLFQQLSSPGSAQNVVQLVLTLSGELNLPAFGQIWHQAVERHQILRTSFYWQGLEKPLQVVRRRVPARIKYHNWQHLPAAERASRLSELLEAERHYGFHLLRAPLMRPVLIKMDTRTCEFVLSYHHLLLDGWSLSLLLQELFAQYEAVCAFEHQPPSPAPSFRDFIAWLQQQDSAPAEDFWRSRLKGFHTPSKLEIGGRLSPAVTDEASKYGSLRKQLSCEQTTALEATARANMLTTSTLVYGAWALLLSRYSGKDDVVFGATVAGRSARVAGVERMLGLFINTLPVRVRICGEERVLTWLRRLQEAMLESLKYEHTSLSDVQRWSEVGGGQPLFDSILIFQNRSLYGKLWGMAGQYAHRLQITDIRAIEQPPYPLTLMVTQESELRLQIDFVRERFQDETIKRVLAHLKEILNSLASNPEQLVREARMLPQRERQQLLSEWAYTERTETQTRGALELFERQAERSPESVAVRFRDSQLTYRELNLRANQLAHYLRDAGVGPEVKVGILLEPCAEQVVAMLAILKAGGAFVPLDMACPPERLCAILEDAGALALLTQGSASSGLHVPALRVVDLEAAEKDIRSRNTDNTFAPVAGESLAYVIYTSGTTGQPKGVLVSHRALATYATAAARAFKLSATDRVLQFAPPGFDVMLEEIFPALLSGARVVLRPGKLSVEQLLRLVREESLTVFELPTAFWHEWMYEASQAKASLPDCVRLVIVGGERNSPARFAAWRNMAHQDVSLVNVYGVTEATVTSTMYKATTEDEAVNLECPMPIGRPLAGTEIYVLDRQLEPVSFGISGELYIGGDCLARGYQNSPELTAQKFIPHPYANRPGARLYRTGDLVRYTSGGHIEFIERIDRQVKVHGFRVELADVEMAIAQYPKLKDVTVVAGQGACDDVRLLAYVVKSEEEATTPTPDALRSFLRERLPEYMIPREFIILEQLPLTSNGKVDHRALPKLDKVRPELTRAHCAPRSEAERMIAAIWQDVLQLEQVGVHDNFFDLGGDSLSMLRIHSQLCDKLGKELMLVEMFTYPTVSALSAHLGQEESKNESYLALPANDGLEDKLTEGRQRLRQQLERMRRSSELKPAT